MTSTIQAAVLAALLMTTTGSPGSEPAFEPDRGLAERFLSDLHEGQPPGTSAEVPTVGCPADGQQGPTEAPRLPPTVKAPIPSATARRLAYYGSGVSVGVLAPRGWRCFARYGSDGTVTIVAPPDAPPAVFTIDAGRTAGPAVILTDTDGSTSGRFTVAKIAARVFPAARGFAESVRAEEIVDRKDFVFAPWPADKLNRLSERAVAFETPPGASGLGDAPPLARGTAPVRGLAVLVGGLDQPSLRVLRVRLAAADAALYPAIGVSALPATGDLMPK